MVDHIYRIEPLLLVLSSWQYLPYRLDGFYPSSVYLEGSAEYHVDDSDRGHEACDRFDGSENVSVDLANCGEYASVLESEFASQGSAFELELLPPVELLPLERQVIETAA